jgi:hypothetical protein
MRFYKAVLRTLITLVSMFSFLGGWILLAHSLKPTQSKSSSSASAILPGVAVTPLPTLAPLQDLNGQQTQAQPIQQNSFSIVAQPQVQSMPVFTTSGS